QPLEIFLRARISHSTCFPARLRAKLFLFHLLEDLCFAPLPFAFGKLRFGSDCWLCWRPPVSAAHRQGQKGEHKALPQQAPKVKRFRPRSPRNPPKRPRANREIFFLMIRRPPR